MEWSSLGSLSMTASAMMCQCCIDASIRLSYHPPLWSLHPLYGL